MSLPRHTDAANIDDLFRQALHAFVDVEPAQDTWQHIVRDLHAAEVEEDRPTWYRWFVDKLGRPLLMRVLLSWGYGFSARCIMSPRQPYYPEPNGKYRSLPFAGAMAQQALHVRLAS